MLVSILLGCLFVAGLTWWTISGPPGKENYHPKRCTILSYRLALLRDSPDQSWLIHGLWPEVCEECPSCGYPTFCNPRAVWNQTALDPIAQTIQTLWYPGVPLPNNTLIVHEWLKHGSCTDLTELEYFNTTICLYRNMQEQGMIAKRCKGRQTQCSLLLNADFESIPARPPKQEL